MKHVTTIIIGAGQAGLATSHHLSALGVDHVLLERGEVANSWKKERWDSLRLLTPNWQSRLPGFTYEGRDPDGFRDMTETCNFLDDYAATLSAPIMTNTTVLKVIRIDGGYKVTTDRGIMTCRTLVMASGAFNIPNVPEMAQELPTGVASLTPMDYKNPDMLDDGAVLVVGGSATGIQLAKEIQLSGRQTYLATGEHVRVPRTYRGKDIKWWMDRAGVLDVGLEEIDDINRARRVPSLQLVGTPEKETLDINALSNCGVKVAGRLMGMHGSRLQFSGSLANVCMLADLKMNRLLNEIDGWIEKQGLAGAVGDIERYEPTAIPAEPMLDLDIKGAGIKTVLWCTGYKPDYSWLDVDALNPRGALRHVGGVVDAPGLYAMGLPFMRKRNSTLIDGVGSDAQFITGHLCDFISGRQKAA